MKLDLQKLDSSLFDWISWRQGCPLVLFEIGCRMGDLYAKRNELRKYAIGWCKGESVLCRPKLNNFAVMFEKDGTCGWFHFRANEFEKIFENHHIDASIDILQIMCYPEVCET